MRVLRQRLAQLEVERSELLMRKCDALILDRSSCNVAYDSFDGVEHNTSKNLRFFELPCVRVCFYHISRCIVNANHCVVAQVSLRENAPARTSRPSCIAMRSEISRKSIGLSLAKSMAPLEKPPRDTMMPKFAPRWCITP